MDVQGCQGLTHREQMASAVRVPLPRGALKSGSPNEPQSLAVQQTPSQSLAIVISVPIRS